MRAKVAASDLAHYRAELTALVSIVDEDERAAVVDLILSEAKDAPKKVGKALAAVRGEQIEHTTPDAKNYAAFLKLWAKCNTKTKRRIATFVASETETAKRGSAA
jgi:hypothetical protein